MNEKLEVEFEGKKLNGILIKENDEFFTLKLSSGYNANLKKSNVKILKREKIEKKKSKKVEQKKENNALPKITILHTGGTIASKVDYRTGAVSSSFTAEELLNLFPELNEIANIGSKLLGNIFSEDMRFEEYNLMLKEIDDAIKNGSQGIIIAHGTDTLHYSSAALQYACHNLSIPVLLVGAQRSSDRASSDAFSNLDAATKYIVNTVQNEKKFRRVGICMHENISDESFLILDGLNAKKMHSTRRDAFKQINYEPFARINNDKVEVLREELLTEKSSDDFSYTLFDTNLKIGFFKVHPNMFKWELENLENYDGIVLEATGIGNVPESESNSEKDSNILNALEELSKKVKIISGVQTVYGEVSLDIYSRGRDIQKTGVIGNRINLITETCFCRLAYCLSTKKFDELWDSNLEGFKIRSEFIEEE